MSTLRFSVFDCLFGPIQGATNGFWLGGKGWKDGKTGNSTIPPFPFTNMILPMFFILLDHRLHVFALCIESV
jgi:hypothetical protein